MHNPLSKSEFGCAKVVYLGHEVGFGKVAPKSSNIQAILDFPVPKNRKNIMQFLGLTGYYRRFVANFSDVANPLSNLLKKMPLLFGTSSARQLSTNLNL